MSDIRLDLIAADYDLPDFGWFPTNPGDSVTPQRSWFYVRVLGAAAACLMVLAACSDSADAGEMTIDDAWVKASDEHMTSAFGILTHPGDDEAVIVSVTSPSSEAVELHETVMGEDGEMSMQEISGGFTIEAGGELILEPGGNHLMLMGLHEPILAGETVTFTATFDNGDEFTFEAVAKDYAGANESYHDDHE